MKWLFIPALLLSVGMSALTREEAKDFLFKSMSPADKADYTEQFYIDNIEISLRAREEMPWGKTVPDREFLHFVLPVRANNETLDSSRMVIYEALKDRVKDLTMEEAILEVNHWCHEHVTYQPSDARTSSPLSSISQAVGRCGEESTLAVAALRAMGIPARQIYTPRWAHTDDNHAWVEVWANGKWYFLGACEPEPVLNLAWFNAPASRGMMMATNVTGDYQGEEEILAKTPFYTRINVTPNYAPVGLLPVKVRYADGSPAKEATVNFCLYNYAEYFPVATKTTDDNGNTSIVSGKGDLVVWATDGEHFGIAKANPAKINDYEGEALTIILDKDNEFEGYFEYDIVPPAASSNIPFVSPEDRRRNDERLAYEDSIRKAYVMTFADSVNVMALAEKLDLEPPRTWKILRESRGNHNNITAILEQSDNDRREKILSILDVVTEKDRRDILMEALADHADNVINISMVNMPNEWSDSQKRDIYDRFVLNPRIEIEFIRPWRGVLHDYFGEELLGEFRDNPEKIAIWIDENINLLPPSYATPARMSPLGVIAGKEADKKARDIFFVAAARTAGIPTRINSVDGNVEYIDNKGNWVLAHTVKKTDELTEENRTLSEIACDSPGNNSDKGFLNLTFQPEGFVKDPLYYSSFSLSKIENGIPQLLDYDDFTPYSKLFEEPLPLAEGKYILTTGQRLANGGVLARSEIFNIAVGDTVSFPLTIRKSDEKISVIGSVNAENIYHDMANETDKSILSTTGRGYYVLGFLTPNHEPSEHALNDISAIKSAFDENGVPVVILFESKERSDRFDRTRFPSLPEKLYFGIDNNSVSLNEIKESLHLDNVSYPLFVIADTFNRIVWVSEGYNIGLGEKILSVLSSID